jgi:hypothetical protein
MGWSALAPIHDLLSEIEVLCMQAPQALVRNHSSRITSTKLWNFALPRTELSVWENTDHMNAGSLRTTPICFQ